MEGLRQLAGHLLDGKGCEPHIVNKSRLLLQPRPIIVFQASTRQEGKKADNYGKEVGVIVPHSHEEQYHLFL